MLIVEILAVLHILGMSWMAYRIVFKERLDYSILGLLLWCQLWPLYMFDWHETI